MLVALKKYKWSETREQLVEQAVADRGLDPEQLMSLIGAISKGRFAQRLAGENTELEPPGYVLQALDFLSES